MTSSEIGDDGGNRKASYDSTKIAQNTSFEILQPLMPNMSIMKIVFASPRGFPLRNLNVSAN